MTVVRADTSKMLAWLEEEPPGLSTVVGEESFLAPPECVLLLRLTSYNWKIHEVLLASSELAACREEVRVAGCCVEPTWGNGLKLFVPVVNRAFSEDLQLQKHHVVIRARDLPCLSAALFTLRKRWRAKWRFVAFVD